MKKQRKGLREGWRRDGVKGWEESEREGREGGKG